MKKSVQFLSLLLTLSILLSAVFSGTASAAQKAAVKCDTTSNFTLAQNSSYTFRLTVTGSSEAPSFTVGNGSALSTRLKSKKGNVYDFQVTAVGNPGTSSAVYTTLGGQAAQRQCVITVGKPPLTGSAYDQANQVAESVVKMALTSNMTNYQKYMALANVAEVGYDNTFQPDSFTAYGDLVKGKAVCSGMALAFQMLCDKAGLPCKSVISTKLNHEWNMIDLGGCWYHIDMQDSHTPQSDQEYLKNGDRTLMDAYRSLPVCPKSGRKQTFAKNPQDGWIQKASEPTFLWKGKTYAVEDNWIISKETGKKLVEVPNLNSDSYDPQYRYYPFETMLTSEGVYIYRVTDNKNWNLHPIPDSPQSFDRGDLIKLVPDTGEVSTLLTNVHVYGHTYLNYDRTTRSYGYRVYYFDPATTTEAYYMSHVYETSVMVN